jgi:hypothetical protein
VVCTPHSGLGTASWSRPWTSAIPRDNWYPKLRWSSTKLSYDVAAGYSFTGGTFHLPWIIGRGSFCRKGLRATKAEFSFSANPRKETVLIGSKAPVSSFRPSSCALLFAYVRWSCFRESLRLKTWLPFGVDALSNLGTELEASHSGVSGTVPSPCYTHQACNSSKFAPTQIGPC